MSNQNEFSDYTLEELKVKKLKVKKTQKLILILCIAAASVAAVVSISKNTNELYPLTGLILVLGIGYPFMAFAPILKKLQTEIDNRSASN